MSSSYRTELGVMQAAANNVQKVNTEIQTHLARIQSEVESLSGAWKGPAAVSFQNLMQQWQADATALNRTLEEIANGLYKSRSNYQVTEEENQQAMAQIMGGR